MTLPSFPDGTDPATMAAIRTAFQDAAAGSISFRDGALDVLEASLLRWLLITAAPGRDNPITSVVLSAVTIQGCLDLAATTLMVIPKFHACCFVEGLDKSDIGINLTDATAMGIEVLGGELGMLRADRLTCSGSLILRSAAIDPPAGLEDGSGLSIDRGVLLSGARIRGNLDLRGTAILPLQDSEEDNVALLADGIAVDGHFLLSEGATASGEIKLNGCRIQRNLDCSSASLQNQAGYSLSAAGAEIQGSVYFTRSGDVHARLAGKLRLDGAHIHGDLDLSGAVITAKAFADPHWVPRRGADSNEDETVALSAIGVSVDASVDLSSGFAAAGSVVLISAKIGSDLIANDASFEFPGETSFCADGATIGGICEFSRSNSNGLIRMVQATLDQGAYFDQFVFRLAGAHRDCTQADVDLTAKYGSDVCGIYAANTSVGGTFIWTKLVREPAGAGPGQRILLLVTPGASLTELNDDEASWSIIDRMDIRDSTYSRITDLSGDIAWRLARLDREYAPWNLRGWSFARLTSEVLYRTWQGERHSAGPDRLGAQIRRFAPTPYLQLGQTLNAAGLEQAARQVFLRLERNRARYSGLSVAGMFWRGVLDAAIGFGGSPFRPVYAFVLPWAVFSAVFFKWVHDRHHMVSTAKDISFNAIFYSIDSLIPFVDFGQRKTFQIEPIFSAGGALLLLNTLLGYAAASFLAAGLSGLATLGKQRD